MDVDQHEAATAPPDGERPTLKTIAFMTGLGVTTVSRALKDAPEIGIETRKRVQLVARQVGYRPNRAGVRLRTGKTNVISLVLDTQEQVGGFVSDIVYGVSEQIAQTPYHLIITPYSRDNDPMEPIRYVVETGSADGIIISRTEPNDPRVRYMIERGFPFATHGRTHQTMPHAFHDFDNAAYARLAVHKLAELGRRRLALMAPYSALSYSQHTRDGFAEGLADTGLVEAPLSGVTADSSLEQIREAAVELDAPAASAGRHRVEHRRRNLRAGGGHRGRRPEAWPRRRHRLQAVVPVAADFPARDLRRRRRFPCGGARACTGGARRHRRRAACKPAKPGCADTSGFAVALR